MKTVKQQLKQQDRISKYLESVHPKVVHFTDIQKATSIETLELKDALCGLEMTGRIRAYSGHDGGNFQYRQ